MLRHGRLKPAAAVQAAPQLNRARQFLEHSCSSNTSLQELASLVQLRLLCYSGSSGHNLAQTQARLILARTLLRLGASPSRWHRTEDFATKAI
ncbi:hypothetical protein BFS86_19220 [Shewanella algae]|nr:hypothetical protein BFS86_19220 [Shewanella algae]